MAGKGPDILILDGISSETYAEQGMLEDLSGILKEAGLLDNIESAYTKDTPAARKKSCISADNALSSSAKRMCPAMGVPPLYLSLVYPFPVFSIA